MWVAVIVSIFSYLSVEMIAVAAGEAQDPEQAVKRKPFARPSCAWWCSTC